MDNLNSNNIICFAAQNAVVDIHYHMCFQLVISMHSSFNCTIGETHHHNIKGFLVNQDIPHSCTADDTGVIVFFIDSESHLGFLLKKILNGNSFLDIEKILTEEQLKCFTSQVTPMPPINELRRISDELLQLIFPAQKEQYKIPIDQRVTTAMEYIDLNMDSPIDLNYISKRIFLSPERTRHLFAQETGIPFSQYVLWKRIKAVMTQVIKKQTPLVNAAIQCGFTDQAHFTRLFKRTFGISAKHLLKNSRSVQFLTPWL